MTETLRPVTRLPTAPPRALVAARGFWLGVSMVVAAAAGFLAHQLMAWPPHEDETLALFVGRDTLPGLIDHVTRDRGGAPLHFLLAWAVAHAGFGLGALRTLSAVFAVASLPLIALLGRRLAGPLVGVTATALAACSWGFLFHGVYGRMYSLFLLVSTASFLVLLRALDHGGRRLWAAWVGIGLLAVAAHPYGALVLAAQGAYVLAERRDRIRQAAWAGVAVLVLGTPFWITDLVLAGRFDVGVGPGGARLGGPDSVARFLWRSAGDFSTGWWWLLGPVLALAAVGLVSVRREARLLAVATVGVPAAAFLTARFGGSASPEPRHLIFALPFLAILVAAGLARVGRRAPTLAAVAVAALLVAEVAWAWQRTAPLFEWEPDQRQLARSSAEAFLASTSRPDDVLLGFDPLFLGAWEQNARFSRIVLPRADSVLALRTLLEQPLPLGRGVWAFDASRRNNVRRRLEIEERSPTPAAAFEARAFGPFLVLRTREPVRSAERYLFYAARAMLVGRSLGIGDAAVNMATVEHASRALRGYGPSLWLRSTDSR